MNKKIFKFFSSLQLAVPLLIAISIFLAYGTFYEAEYGTVMAQKHVYHSLTSMLLMGLLIINLACAVIDRYPWKKHHIGFIITHAGIITLLFGAFITQQKGLDGSLYLPINEKSKYFVTPDTEIRVYQSIDEKPYVLLINDKIDFDKKNPGTRNYEYKLVDNDVLKISEYIPFAKKTAKVVASKNKEQLPAVRFKIYNQNVSVEEWVGLAEKLPPFYDLGPALITFIKGPLTLPPQLKNQIVLYQESKNSKINYAIFSSKQKQPFKKGTLKQGDKINTGWMNLVFEVPEILLNAEVDIKYTPSRHDEPMVTPVIFANIASQSGWFELDSPRIIKGERSSYYLSFSRKRYELGFEMQLKKFKMGLYEGSQLPASYESTVSVNGEEPVVISMNEPLKKNGLTLYQSSFENNEQGVPIASIFSVNYDPGRIIKYIGTTLVVLGIATMFYIKPRWSRKKG
ncbi:MAG: cytochrome c biogenesis protein ResB [Oligoflexia bacterium]|nr:cytochrome c biogenesis protein ResB [Oligoflexia bacterium]